MILIKISAEEVSVLKKNLVDYAKDDKRLDDNEILQMFNIKDANSEKAQKILTQFKIMVERQVKGSLKTEKEEIEKQNGKAIKHNVTSNFNRDGSGTEVDSSAFQTVTCTYTPRHVLTKKVVKQQNGTVTTINYTNNEKGQATSEKSITKTSCGKIIEEETTYTYTYTDDGKILDIETKEYTGKRIEAQGKRDARKTTKIHNEYDKKGHLTKKTTNVKGSN